MSRHWYSRCASFARRYFSWLVRDKERYQSFLSDEYIDILRFIDLDVEPIDVLSFAFMVAFLTLLILIVIDSIILFIHLADGLDFLNLLLMLIVTIILPFITMNLIASYPRTIARYTEIHSMGDIPEVLSYLIMYLKLVPNLENSIKFAARESNTSLAKLLRKMIWDMEIRVYHGLNDALTRFTSRWGRWSDHFKRAMHLVRSSLEEPDDAQRIITLNKALDVGLEGTRELMSRFVARLHQPTLVIYSIGVMLPLSLVAMLPAVSLVGVKITILQIFLLYDVILPIILYLYMRKILLSRPATFNPPSITRHSDFKYTNSFLHIAISIIIASLVSTPWFYYTILNRDSTSIISILPLWSISLGLYYYTAAVYRPYKKIRDDVKSMEKEFTEALYIIGRRVSEDKSAEEGFLYTANTMSGSHISSIFRRVSYNLFSLHNTLEEALFHPRYGALRRVYSDRIKAIMKLFVEGVRRSQRSAGLSIIKIADHLKDLQEVENRIKENLSGLTGTLRSTAVVFAPLIAGVTVAITRVVTLLLLKMNPSSSVYNATMFTVEAPQINYFILAIGVYIIQLVILLTRFTNGLEEGDDKVEYMYSLGKALPISVSILTVSIMMSQYLFSNILNSTQ